MEELVKRSNRSYKNSNSYGDLLRTSFSPDYSTYITTVALLAKDFFSEFSCLFPCNMNREAQKIICLLQ